MFEIVLAIVMLLSGVEEALALVSQGWSRKLCRGCMKVSENKSCQIGTTIVSSVLAWYTEWAIFVLLAFYYGYAVIFV